MSAITNALLAVIEWLYTIIRNHGWSIVVFTILIRLVLMPLDIQSRKGMRKMAKIQPQLNALQKKYANDRAKLQQKQSELMRKEHYSPLSGCLPLLIQMPILFAMFGAMRNIANERLVEQAFAFLQGKTPEMEGWLWVKNIFMPDSLFASAAPNVQALQVIPHAVWQDVFGRLSQANQQLILQNITQQLSAQNIQTQLQTLGGILDFSTDAAFKANLPLMMKALEGSVENGIRLGGMEAYLAMVKPLPGWANMNFFLFTVTVYQHFNGLLILPVAAGLSQLVMTKLNPQMSGQAQPAAGSAQQPGMGNFMKYFFPLFSVYICLSSNAGFALYWVTSNLVASGMNYFISLYFDRKEQQASDVIHQEGTVE